MRYYVIAENLCKRFRNLRSAKTWARNHSRRHATYITDQPGYIVWRNAKAKAEFQPGWDDL